MIEQLETVGGFEKDTTELESFYESVRVNVGNIDNLEGKQTIIKNLYEKFFKGAFPLTVENSALSIRQLNVWTSSFTLSMTS